jgi:aldehyde dehydrogenase (NAD+)
MDFDFLKPLGIEADNAGACFGPGDWSRTRDSGVIESVNPATGKVIARVHGATTDDYERVIRTAREVFEHWRSVPAPRRGEAIRLCADALRQAQGCARQPGRGSKWARSSPRAMAKCRR